ncbi:hypothetical protein CCAX7_59610 [Capsulimonas corticalis]|uniref:Uncharacterized protein n=1 Tax=Capsulimonas corticalis TaxID=2219043 RepID=A0A402CZM0_9BACT|nr:hypothetical protein [Capsulimonas corticalis]BDI33910.1 hypothetical protein CCAX7_59610 [Capsulimonas corticalis]
MTTDQPIEERPSDQLTAQDILHLLDAAAATQQRGEPDMGETIDLIRLPSGRVVQRDKKILASSRGLVTQLDVALYRLLTARLVEDGHNGKGVIVDLADLAAIPSWPVADWTYESLRASLYRIHGSVLDLTVSDATTKTVIVESMSRMIDTVQMSGRVRYGDGAEDTICTVDWSDGTVAGLRGNTPIN